MTVTPDVHPADVDGPEQALALLRDAGLRISTARRLVVEALFAAREPVGAQALARELGLEESSVYRNLEVLERHGLARHLHLGHGPGLYVPAGPERAEYLYCERCGQVTTVAPEQLDEVRALVRERFGLAARFSHFAIVGTCARCATRAEADG